MKAILTLLFLLTWSYAEACSSAIVSPRASKEGCVMLWKHRDQTATQDTRIAHFDDGKYAYTALVNSYHAKRYTVYGGINEVGFGIISTATKNLNRADSDSNPPVHNHSLMTTALRECATVEQFEALLATYKRAKDFQSNIGVGDSSGCGAYFEIWGDGYRRYNVDEKPLGYDIRTNFSFAGRVSDRGRSVRRYRTVEELMSEQSLFSSADFFGFSRNFYSADKGDILANDKPHKEANYIIPRPSSVGSMVIVCGKNPRIDIIVGHPVAGFAVPVWVAAKNNIPQCVASRGMFDLSRAFVAKAYDKREDGTFLNKDVVRRALTVNTRIKSSSAMPADIASFNQEVDKTFTKHRKKMLRVLE